MNQLVSKEIEKGIYDFWCRKEWEFRNQIAEGLNSSGTMIDLDEFNRYLRALWSDYILSN